MRKHFSMTSTLRHALALAALLCIPTGVFAQTPTPLARDNNSFGLGNSIAVMPRVLALPRGGTVHFLLVSGTATAQLQCKATDEHTYSAWVNVGANFTASEVRDVPTLCPLARINISACSTCVVRAWGFSR